MNPRLRLGVLAVVIVSLFSVMFARLWYLQVLAAPEYRTIAENNAVRIVTQPGPRGRILDRQGRVIVDNVPMNVVTVSRALVGGERDEVVTRLAALLRVPAEEIRTRLASERYSPFRPVPVAEGVSDDVLVYIGEHQDLFPGVEATRQAVRHYPHGSLAAHLVGYVGEITREELDARRGQGYRLGDTVGRSGVEKVYEDALRGRAGATKLEVDARGKVLRTLGEDPPEQGNDVVLSLDLDVQRLAEESLARGLGVAKASRDREARRSFVAPAGSVVVLDPRDGSVVAMASYPTFEPVTFLRPVPPAEYEAKFGKEAQYPLNNRTTQGLYAPGSTFKLFTALAGLRSGLINANTTIVDRGSYRIPNCRGNCSRRNAGGRAYGSVALRRAMTVSSDVYFYSLGYQFWTNRARYGNAMQDTARDFGFASKTGFPIGPELAGRVPDPESRERDHTRNPVAFPERRWFAGDNINLSIGQGETVVTPLQLANAYATFANGGTVFSPRVALEVRGRGGDPVRRIEPTPTRRVEIPAAHRDPLMAGLLGAVQDAEGTAHGAFAGFPLATFPVAGKTGTAQVRGKQDTALFVGVAPLTNPQYVVSVVMEEAGFGGAVAAPVARRILAGIAGHEVGDVSIASGVD